MEVCSSPHKPLFRQRSFSFDELDFAKITGDDFYHSDQFEFGNMSEVCRLGLTTHKVGKKWRSENRLATELEKRGYVSEEENDFEMSSESEPEDITDEEENCDMVDNLPQSEEEFQSCHELSNHGKQPLRESMMIVPICKSQEEWTHLHHSWNEVRSISHNKQWKSSAAQLHIVSRRRGVRVGIWRMTETTGRNESVYFFGFQRGQYKFRFVSVDRDGNVIVGRPEHAPSPRELKKEARMFGRRTCRAFCIGPTRGNGKALVTCFKRNLALKLVKNVVKTGTLAEADFWEW